MTIAFTADLHLKEAREEAPARYHALVNIFDQLQSEGILTLIIAGDLYDKDSTNHYEFDELCRAYPEIRVYLIPGNHDPGLKPEAFTAENLTVITTPHLLQISDNKLSVLCLPYQSDQSMGEALAGYQAEIAEWPTPNRWVLVGHGDYLGTTKTPNHYEPGIYMPLSASDLERYQPGLVILGHIHQRTDSGKIHYPGSPCGLDITETGRRYFSLLDEETLTIEAKPIDTDFLYFSETLVSLPLADEDTYIRKQLESLENNWQLAPEDYPKVRLRLTVKGYTNDKAKLKTLIENHFDQIQWVDDGPDLTHVHINPDPLKQELIEKTKRHIETRSDELEALSLSEAEVLEKTLNRIIGF